MPTFKLEMFTPKKQFFVGEVDAVTCNAFDGELCVLHGHQPMIVALPPGEIKIKQDERIRQEITNKYVVD